MRELFKTHFALTDKGAKDLQKASAASFFVYVINFFPAMLLLLLVDELLLNNVKETGLYLWGSILVLAVMWILLRIEYDALYNTTYQESANLRTEIADILTKLPLSYFSRQWDSCSFFRCFRFCCSLAMLNWGLLSFCQFCLDSGFFYCRKTFRFGSHSNIIKSSGTTLRAFRRPLKISRKSRALA